MVWQQSLLVTSVNLVGTLPIETVKIQGDPLQLEAFIRYAHRMYLPCDTPHGSRGSVYRTVTMDR